MYYWFLYLAHHFVWLTALAGWGRSGQKGGCSRWTLIAVGAATNIWFIGSSGTGLACRIQTGNKISHITLWNSYGKYFSLQLLENTSLFCRVLLLWPLVTPLLGFKARVDPLLASSPVCNGFLSFTLPAVCWPLNDQHGRRAFSIDTLVENLSSLLCFLIHSSLKMTL